MNTNSIKERINTISKNQQELVRLKRNVEDQTIGLDTILENLVKDELHKVFPKCNFELLASINGGIFCEGWIPAVFIYTADSAQYTNKDFWVIEEKKVSSKIDANKLMEKCEELSKEYNINVQLVIKKIKTKEDIKSIRNEEDLKIVYEGIDIIEKGHIWIKGWDISDPFFICKLNGKFMLFVSTNGHGFGIDLIVTEKSPLKDLYAFFDAIEEDDTYLLLRDKYIEKIIKNWDLEH